MAAYFRYVRMLPANYRDEFHEILSVTETVILVPAMHRGAEYIFIRCSDIKSLNDVIKRVPGVKWSQTHKAWHIPLDDTGTFQY